MHTVSNCRKGGRKLGQHEVNARTPVDILFHWRGLKNFKKIFLEDVSFELGFEGRESLHLVDKSMQGQL